MVRIFAPRLLFTRHELLEVLFRLIFIIWMLNSSIVGQGAWFLVFFKKRFNTIQDPIDGFSMAGVKAGTAASMRSDRRGQCKEWKFYFDRTR